MSCVIRDGIMRGRSLWRERWTMDDAGSEIVAGPA